MKPSFPITRRADGTSWDELEKGEFAYKNPPETGNIKWLSFWPEDSNCPLMIAISPQRAENGCSWTLSGSLDAPTIIPSIDCAGYWHGHITDGRTRLA